MKRGHFGIVGLGLSVAMVGAAAVASAHGGSAPVGAGLSAPLMPLTGSARADAAVDSGCETPGKAQIEANETSGANDADGNGAVVWCGNSGNSSAADKTSHTGNASDHRSPTGTLHSTEKGNASNAGNAGDEGNASDAGKGSGQNDQGNASDSGNGGDQGDAGNASAGNESSHGDAGNAGDQGNASNASTGHAQNGQGHGDNGHGSHGDGG